MLSLRRPAALKKYKMTIVVDILPTKADGGRWDPAGDPPDPIFEVRQYTGNTLVTQLPPPKHP